MTTKLILINTDTHAVVPREFIAKVRAANGTTNLVAKEIWLDEAIEVYEKAPQFTTPPVLRWERCILKCGNVTLCYVHSHGLRYGWVIRIGDYPMDLSDTIDEARRAAEKALGIEFEVEEVK